MKKSILLLITLLIVSALPAAAQRHTERPFFDKSAPSKFLELRAYALAGGSTITQNYIKCFPEINELNASMGMQVGAGVSVQFALRDFLALGTELNLTANNYNLDLAVTGDQVSSVSSVFLKNRYYTASMPVFLSFRFNALRGLKWNVDIGTYYTYGLGGHQRQAFYDAHVNEIGQLVMNVERRRVGYYNGNNAFINSFSRGDFGMHIGTGLSFGRHIFLVLRSEIGFKNLVKTDGIIRPNCHTANLVGRIGWKF